MGGALTNAISVLQEKTQTFALTLCSQRRYKEKTAIYEVGSGVSPDIRSAGILILDF